MGLFPMNVGGGGTMNREVLQSGCNSHAQYTIDVAAKLPNLYRTLTIDNFALTNVTMVWVATTTGYMESLHPVPSSYDSTTGKLTCPYSTTFSDGYIFYFTYDVVCYY